MQDKWKWLAVPPALALLLFFGPFGNQTPPSVETNPPKGVVGGAVGKDLRPSASAPSAWQMVSTMVGLCLLGTAVVLGIARVRRNQQTTPGNAVLLRQSLRLSNRHAVHAVQFDDKILLLGECDGSLRVLRTSADPDVAAAEILTARPPLATSTDDDDDEGAVLKDMIIPRPSQGGSRASAKVNKPAGLNDFRTLLKKANLEV